ncbi:MAG: hypothetical protein IJJ00_03860 [Erysipelotrichaceae bacterium]|nr:hypothetical protein [Erysipelotrichaceae bacterium]
MLLNIISIIINFIYYVVLNAKLYTDRAVLPDGEMHHWQRSPIDRLYAADMPVLLYLQLAFIVISIVSALLLLFSVKNSTIKTVSLISTAASTVMFIIIMIFSAGIHVHY